MQKECQKENINYKTGNGVEIKDSQIESFAEIK